MFYIFLSVAVLILLYLEFRPFRNIKIKEEECKKLDKELEGIKKYSVIVHIHTQFSFDSLGKPSDIKKAMEENGIDFVFVTDHDNDDYRFFEYGQIFAGIEKNTPEGRLLLLGNTLPVISHPNNFEFEHYRWKGEFKKDYLYEIINIKDGVVWNKALSIISLVKNLILLPFTRNILHKWNALIPLEKWVRLYFARAKGLKLVGGLDLHVKLVYQEHTHGILIPSYRSGFKWLVNRVYSRRPITEKEDILKALKNGNLFLSLKQTEGDFWGEFEGEVYLPGEKIPKETALNCMCEKSKTVKLLKYENIPVVITEKGSFSYTAEREGFYHFEVYEYDFKIGSIYFGFRPVIITNPFEVVNG
ncbi:PHP domain-containing protein [Persephonella atlantica]|uniref:PHP domain-containing protein n=1 Tax=Persephonella atlantica TaxID=2699429 RepID=UPI001A933423|nr:PHP domain-containing protein [Persephonella atlantica]